LIPTEPARVGPLVIEGPGRVAGERAHPDALRDRVIAAVNAIRDPEIPLGVWDLGLIYAIDIGGAGAVSIRMTLTAPGCPVASEIVQRVHAAAVAIAGVTSARVELVWDPPWTKDRIPEATRLALGL
jgi:metal-sulfur cluster biosynthetic enzyme